MASTTFNAPILDTRNRPLNCAVYKQQQVLPQDRCTVCKDFYTKSLSHKTQHCSYEASNVRTSKKCNENRISYQEVKNPTPRKVVNKQAQSMKPAVCCAEQVILKEQKVKHFEKYLIILMLNEVILLFLYAYLFYSRKVLLFPNKCLPKILFHKINIYIEHTY